MKVVSIASKINKMIFAFMAFALLIVIVLLSYSINEITKTTFKKSEYELKITLKQKLNLKEQVGLTNAIALAHNPKIIEALATGQRELAIDTLKSTVTTIKNSSDFKNIKIHIHDNRVHSFLREWKPNKFGDDLNSFRKTIQKVQEIKKPLSAVEVGRAGLVLRGLSPIFDKNGGLLGSIEFIQGFNSIAKELFDSHKHFMVLMDEKYKRGNALTNESKIDNYYISQKFQDIEFLKALKNIDIKELINKKQLIGEDFFYISKNILDINNNIIGVYIIAEEISYIDKVISLTTNAIYTLMTSMGLLIIIFLFVLNRSLNKNISGGLTKFRSELKKFLKYISYESNRYIPSKVYGNDEISLLLTELNETYLIYDKKLKEDIMVMGEISITNDKVSKGNFKCRVHSNSMNPMINTLRGSINDMLTSMNKNINNIISVLSSYAQHDYRPKITDTQDLTGELLDVITKVNLLGDALTNSAKNSMNNGQKLQQDANIAKESVQNLSTKANEQAASLEQTSASVEEIAGTTKNNSENTDKMATLGQEVRSLVHSGHQLANSTTESMDDINTQVNAINEAISIIDQIAFQTSILSLNAAVEAATAGEAGKGFAVVAQEVRNLASRSADAAKEIKNIVDKATKQANNGKQIADKMIVGYEKLNHSIKETIELIDMVNLSSAEQLSSITQINDTVSTLDTMTQQNASETTNVAEIINNLESIAQELLADAKSKRY